MTVASEFDARLNIRAFIDRLGRPYEEWYAGTAADARGRLIGHHMVDEVSGWWIVEELASAESARKIEESLVKAGCKGGVGDGSGDAATQVYAYLKGADTNP